MLTKNFPLVLSFFLCFSLSAISKEQSIIPGRLGYPEICIAQFGKTRLLFYMTPEKHKLAQDFITDVEDNMLHTMLDAELDFPVSEVTPVATKFRDPIDFDTENNPIYVDQKGMTVFENHAQKVKEIAEKTLGVTIHALSKEMSLILNSDANKFHQDQFIPQYEFLKNHSYPIPQYILFQDLTLIDWELAKGTFSGTILQDEESNDRFIFPLFEKEIACTVYTEPALYLGSDTAPDYPGANTLPPHSPIPALDLYGFLTPGSAKGKRISVAIRGLIQENQMLELEDRSTLLPVNRYQVLTSINKNIIHQYPNGILINELTNHQPLAIEITWAYRHPDQENMEIFETNPTDNISSILILQKTFGLQCSINEVKVKHLIKKDGGFSRFSLEHLDISKDSILVLVNSSKIPIDYMPYPIAEDFTEQGKPWIQLYYFPTHMAMLLPAEKFNDLSLTPVEELIFRDALYDIACTDPNILRNKIVTQLDIFIFPKSAKEPLI